MSQLPRYESYKDSGVQWLGEIPSHWKVTRLKFMAKIQNGSDYKHVQAEDGYPVIGSGGQFTYATEYLYKGESVLLGRKGTIDRPLYVNCAFWTVDTMYYTEIFNITFPKFLYYCALTVDFWKYSTQTALPSMTQTALSNLMFATPEYAEQKIIADFLDKRLAQVDALIAKQETLLEKLAEQRVALISHAVTKGLNPDVEMKESDVEWLGKVPKSWGIANLRYFITCNSGDALESSRILRDADECNNIPVIGGNGLLGFTENSNYKNECIAVGRVGALCGNVHFINYESWINDNALLIKLISDKFNINYLVYLLRSRNLNELASKTAQPLLTGTQVKAEKVCIPLMKEQLEIVRYLDTNLQSLDRLLETVNKTIQTLREYRSTLITQVVTGKIDVRNLKVN